MRKKRKMQLKIRHQKIQRRHDINNSYKQNYTYFIQTETPMNIALGSKVNCQIAADTDRAGFHLRRSIIVRNKLRHSAGAV